MRQAPRKLAFILAASDQGTLGFGVGLQILSRATFEPQEIDLAVRLLDLRRRYFGDGVVTIDCGSMPGFAGATTASSRWASICSRSTRATRASAMYRSLRRRPAEARRHLAGLSGARQHARLGAYCGKEETR